MREINLSRGHLATIDDCDFDRINQIKWHFSPGTGSRLGYAVARINGKTTYMHRFILGALRGQEVDHADRNSLNNVRSNLRFATRSQQCADTLRARVPQSGYRGVFLVGDGSADYWAEITVRGSRIRGARKLSPVDCARDYDAMAIEHFGEFAITNFPSEVAP